MEAGRLILVTSDPGLTEPKISLASLKMDSSLSGGGFEEGRCSMRVYETGMRWGREEAERSEEVKVSRASTKASSSDSGVEGRGGTGAEAGFGVAAGVVAAVAIVE